MNPARQSDDETLIRYLLGYPLPEDVVDRLEERYFQNDRYFDHLAGLEEDLIDSYICGNLSHHDRTQFETHFLASAHRRKKWEAQQAIATFFRSSTAPAPFLVALRRFLRSQSLAVRWTIASAMLILAAGLGLLGAGYIRLEKQTGGSQPPLAELEDRARGAALSTFLLEPGLLRAGEGNRLQVPASADWLALRLRLPPAEDRHSNYVAALSTAEGEELWRQSRLSQTGGIVEIRVPTLLLSRGDYVLSLTGTTAQEGTSLPSYVFSVEGKH